MKRVINHLRKQSEENKRHILHISTLVCGAVLVSLWVYSLGSGLGTSEAKAKTSQDLKPFSVLKDNIKLPESW